MEVLLVVMVLVVPEVPLGDLEVLLGLLYVHLVALEDMEVHQEVHQVVLLVPQAHPIVGHHPLVWEAGVCHPGEVLLGVQVHQVPVLYLHLEVGDHSPGVLKEDRTIQEEGGDHLQLRNQLI